MIKVLVVDDDVIFQGLLCKLLGSHGIQVVGMASNAEQASLLYQVTSPDVVLVDLGSGDNRDKVETLSRIKELDSSAKLIVLSIFNCIEDIVQGKDDLIDAYVIKGSSSKQIIDTVREVAVSGGALTAISDRVKGV